MDPFPPGSRGGRRGNRRYCYPRVSFQSDRQRSVCATEHCPVNITLESAGDRNLGKFEAMGNKVGATILNLLAWIHRLLAEYPSQIASEPLRGGRRSPSRCVLASADRWGKKGRCHHSGSQPRRQIPGCREGRLEGAHPRKRRKDKPTQHAPYVERDLTAKKEHCKLSIL